MAEPLKNSFGPEVAIRIADMITAVHPDFDRERFLEQALDGFEDLELKARARLVADALATVLPRDRGAAMDLLVASLGPEIEGDELSGMASFLYLPHVMFVAEHGLEDYEAAMRAQHELTRRFTAEFSIRAYLERYPEKTLRRLRAWAADPNVHVRRLVSEGTRPRLPWAGRLRAFQADPSPVLELLELLKDDPEEYVRRSVANNLNDIAKDHPELVVSVARRWWKGADENRRALVRHGLRTLVKQGDPDALALLGYGAKSPVVVRGVTCTPSRVAIGGKVVIEIELENPSARETSALVDFRVHFIKSDGEARPKVFKGAEVVMRPGEATTIRRTVSVAQHTTRKHYPGVHHVDVLLNGTVHTGGSFRLTP